jgi:predicted transcriptional regulator
MLSRGEDVEVNALVERGWNISAIARHLGRDRGTISNYVNGKTIPGVRRPAGPGPAGAVRRLRERPLRRRPAPVGDGALRRGRGHGL